MTRSATLLLLLVAPALWHPRHSHAQNLPSSEQVLPPGFGTLKQEDLQIALATTALEIRFTPLDPRVINLLAPDAYTAMAALVKNNRPRIDSAARVNAVSRPGIAFVQFYGLQPGANFDAQSLVLVFRGRLLRPISIIPYSQKFTDGRLEPRQLVTAFYLFEEQIPVLEPFTPAVLPARLDRVDQQSRREDQQRAPARAAAVIRRHHRHAAGSIHPATPSTEPADVHAAPLTSSGGRPSAVACTRPRLRLPPTCRYSIVTQRRSPAAPARDSVTHPWQSGAPADTRIGDFCAVPVRAAQPDIAGACPTCTRAPESHAPHSIARVPCLPPHADARARRTCRPADRPHRRSHCRERTGCTDRRGAGPGHRYRHPYGVGHRRSLHAAERAGGSGIAHRAHAGLRAQDGDGTGGHREGRGRAEHLPVVVGGAAGRGGGDRRGGKGLDQLRIRDPEERDQRRQRAERRADREVTRRRRRRRGAACQRRLGGRRQVRHRARPG